MPLSGGTAGIHDDYKHRGSAKRDFAEGLAGLDASGHLLVIGHRVVVPRGTSEQITIRERTSNERAFRVIRNGANDYEARVNVGGAEEKLLSSMPVHGAADHTDIARELFIPVMGATDGVDRCQNYYYGAALADALVKEAWSGFKVPADYSSNGVVHGIILADASGDMANKIRAVYASDGQAYNTHIVDPGANVEAVTEDYMNVLTAGTTLTDLAVGDVVGLRFMRSATLSSDTVNAICYLIGFVFKYTANQ